MVYDKAHELAKALRLSPEYRQFQEAREKVSKNPESQKVLEDFHKKQLEIQAMQMLGKEIPPEKLREYERMSEILNYHPSVREFLQAEYKIAQMLADIQKILTQALDLEFPKNE